MRRLAAALTAIAMVTVAAGVARYSSGVSQILAFVLATLSLAGLAWIVSFSTEQVGRKFGPGATGLMQSTVGNLPEFFVVLFALLVVFTTRWTVIDKSSLDNNALNHLTLIQELKIKRCRILADDGTVLAQSVPGAGGTWNRTYPTVSLFAQAVGYSNLAQGQAAGLELSDWNYTRGLQTGLNSVFGQLTPHRVGDDVYTTLDATAQRLAASQLAGRVGSVVALDPRTGAVLAMYANPTYDDNHAAKLGPGQ